MNGAGDGVCAGVWAPASARGAVPGFGVLCIAFEMASCEDDEGRAGVNRRRDATFGGILTSRPTVPPGGLLQG